MNFHVSYILKDKTSKKKFPPVCPSGCAYVDFRCGHNNFRKS